MPGTQRRPIWHKYLPSGDPCKEGISVSIPFVAVLWASVGDAEMSDMMDIQTDLIIIGHLNRSSIIEIASLMRYSALITPKAQEITVKHKNRNERPLQDPVSDTNVEREHFVSTHTCLLTLCFDVIAGWQFIIHCWSFGALSTDANRGTLTEVGNQSSGNNLFI
ncbi:hypothetical protein AVEN_42974-1 [Araneus ventricosus]|uniref:Uncharacterized protein n=1 Tax=Araneus ventricosus TaxID=182803 RepID=A0A4Y2AFJ8_ARAVE|nr:hypothetical protein AVEN_42974-1 [Araneus ventricosus]